MRARSAEYITAAAKPRGYPPAAGPEIAFAGRSNVGKSSLINALAGVSGLARTSRTPGRTRLLHWFAIRPPKGKDIAFVDLPGFGYAKVSKTERESWRPLVEGYLANRQVLRAVVLLIDCRRGVQDEERDLAAWIEELGVPVIPVLTKIDKIPKSKRKPIADEARRELGAGPAPICFSALKNLGSEALWGSIAKAVTAPKPG